MNESNEVVLSRKIANMAFLCACLVVFLHVESEPVVRSASWWFKTVYCRSIGKVTVPFFFIVSGYFLARHIGESGWWKRETVKRVTSLLVPYLLWSLIFLAFAGTLKALGNLHYHRPWSEGIPIHGWECAEIFGLTVELPYLGPLWYVRCLFCLVLISPLYVWLYRRSRVLYAGFMALLLLYYFSSESWHSFHHYQSEGLFFFGLGLLLRFRPITFSVSRLTACALGVTALAYTCADAYLDFCVPEKGLVLPTRLLMPVLLLSVWSLMPSTHWPSALVSLAFPLYIVHKFVTVLIGSVWRTVLGRSRAGLGEMVVDYVLALAISLLVPYLLIRFFPGLSRWLFGGRGGKVSRQAN